MSLPDVSFTNNLGTISFKRCLLGITDSWEFNGRVARQVKSITVDGHVARDGVGEGFEGALSDRGVDGRRYGDVGSLTLPWKTFGRIKLSDLSMPENSWIDMVPVQATFVDEWPNQNSYTMTFFGITVYNPRLAMPIPVRQLRDEYPLMPAKKGIGFPSRDPRVGVFRNRATQKNLDLTLSGSIRMDDNMLPPTLIPTLIQRANMGVGDVTFTVNTGYPRPFNLGDAIPEVKDDLNLAHVIVVGAQIVWHVEDQEAQLGVQMLCPPQILGR